ncbi:MAG: HAMP domain-containing histidine kinase [Ardenticatenaceae bacterium]|nr:HAMP domain-containing histidine kinase [Ardenticatenaceae bacterium]
MSDLPPQLLTHLVSTGRLAYAQITPALIVSQVSANFCQMVQCDETVLGQPLTEICAEFVGVEPMLEAIAAGTEAGFRLEQVQRTLPDGDTGYLTLQLLPLADTAGILLVVEDTTRESRFEQELVQERNELRLLKAQLLNANEQLYQLNQFKNMFISMAAHDLRTPLFVVHGYLQMIMADSMLWLPEEYQQYIQNSLNQIQWLNNLVTDLLTLDKIEQGQIVIKANVVDLKQLVQQSLELFADLALDRKQEIVLVLPETAVSAYGEANRIKQVLFNLLGNAFKYTPDGGTVRVALWEGEETAVLQISDTGPGMTPIEQDELFQPYYRTRSAQQSNITGIGLGLFIAKTLVEAHGGSISVDSTLGKGTLFTTSWPLPPKPENINHDESPL